MNRLPLNFLADNKTSTEDIVSYIKTKNCSILKSIGANRLRIEMIPVGILCRLILWIILLNPKRKFKRACALLDYFFPTHTAQNKYNPDFANRDSTALVIYFNHQSLFEVLATISWCLRYYQDKNYIFPVNLPWYECLAPASKQLAKLGIYITPIITPKTFAKLSSNKRSKKYLEQISRLKIQLSTYYFELIGQYALTSDIIAVAPSAGRIETIFPNEKAFHHGNDENIEAKTMSAVVLSIRRIAKKDVGNIQVDFVPFTFVPIDAANDGLNIFRNHECYIGNALNLKQMTRLQKLRKVDFVARRKLAQNLPLHIQYPQKATE